MQANMTDFRNRWNNAKRKKSVVFWIAVDAVFDQVPADVSHIRLVTGSPSQQLDLIGIIGKLQLKVIDPP